jgi:DNA-binding NarL/FixJ family response regulator
MSERKKSVLVVEDHPVMREGIKNILRQNTSLKVVKETDDAEEALAYAKENGPDLALVDITLPSRMGGIELTAALSQLRPRIPVVILSVHSKIEFVGQAIDAGAFAYVNKESEPKILHEAIHSALSKTHYIDSSFSPGIAKKLRECAVADRNISENTYGSLTPREQEVLRMLSEGLNTSDISNMLRISPRTSENYRSAIYKKLSVKNRTELFRYCIKIGLTDPDKI